MNLENYNDKLFFSIWRNIVLRKVIINELKLFSIFRKVNFKINTNEEYQYWLDYKYKIYLKRVRFFISFQGLRIFDLQRLILTLLSLPENIDTVEIETNSIIPICNIFNPGFIPRSVTSLELIGSFSSPFSKNSIHSNLKSLILNDQLSLKLYHLLNIGKVFLPKSLTSLTFGDSFNTEIGEGCLPSSITYLEFGYHFNCEIGKNVLPKRLKILKFGELFNKSLSTRQCFYNRNKLKKLYLGREYQGEFIEFTFPKSLKELVFSIGCKFNHPLEVGVLPPSLKTLIIGERYFKSEIESLPISLKYLSINCSQSIENVSPFLKNLKKLELTSFLVPLVRRILNDTDFH
ncbi:hypothetical protein DDB_G0272278 [Dictyostelium discoideum AX4]|uniref:FNIP repeat-containing protein n=1 Tax=Dictyostelium discoideum TaxID=44689 RepID=Q559U3_DICDI|nr:hypothetical protein DDB_G0272278 [Dictyostelium discoideum AX4]EAL71291.1 hypothetical protein DDB_G0272278 [Dictyostelium discoideum AX4]|eukprot:XP_645241.1 hypothetical protein DDB_G0272278 [Dictyostelium discoideum AX4]